ncbi:hypothetical protein GQ53DRAFT_645988 [Thozetella sp. PMI_491]|nr:hypothetical protein GQ53DRAFT_645988 [Thozetella sp. PMI_491]
MAASVLSTKVIAGVTVVDTPIVRAAQDYARAHGDDMAFNHVMRSWILGVVAYQKLHERGAVPKMDLEAHALSAILHDLGWDTTGELISADKRFEVDGAEAARNWIRAEERSSAVSHWDEHRLQLVWDAIALHTTNSISMYKETVVKVCSLGIGADFRGPKLDDAGTISQEVYDAVNTAFPRLDLAAGIRKIMCGFCLTKPETTYGECRSWSLPYSAGYVEGYNTDGKLTFDIVETTI